eukprot:2842584-Rhodomonas_salina.6
MGKTSSHSYFPIPISILRVSCWSQRHWHHPTTELSSLAEGDSDATLRPGLGLTRPASLCEMRLSSSCAIQLLLPG